LNQNAIFELASGLMIQFNTTYPVAVKPYRSFPLDPFNLTGYFDFAFRIRSEHILLTGEANRLKGYRA